MTADRALLWLLRLNAAVLLCAAPCVLLPFGWMDSVHRQLLGTPFPDLPITRYMARSLSLLYASFGLCTLFVTLDWQRYRTAAHHPGRPASRSIRNMAAPKAMCSQAMNGAAVR